MAQTQIPDVVVPAEFSAYIVENSMVSTAIFQSGVAVPNGIISEQLQAGSTQFTVPVWSDDGESETDVTSDNIAVLSTPLKLTAVPQVIRKSLLHQSWSEMSLASELAGSDALARVQSRVLAYWQRQYERRIIASMLGVLYSNVANDASDMVNDISGLVGTLANFNGDSVIDTALTLGDRLSDVKMIAMHSKIYGEALKNDEITFFKPSDNSLDIPTYKGMGVIVDDNLTTSTAGLYVTVLMGPGAFGFGVSEPRTGFSTELFRIPSAGNGGGNTTLHTRYNSAFHPLGMSFTNASVAGESPLLAELALPANWTRAVTQRKSIPLAFLVSH
jgi:hypothetical protein